MADIIPIADYPENSGQAMADKRDRAINRRWSSMYPAMVNFACAYVTFRVAGVLE